MSWGTDFFIYILIGIGILLGMFFLGVILHLFSKLIRNRKIKRLLKKVSDFLTNLKLDFPP